MALTTVATTTSGQLAGAASTDALNTEYSIDAIEYVRSLIDPMPGSGQVRGVWMYKGIIYGFRDDELGLECRMYVSTTAGWVQVTTPTLAPGGKYEFINHNFGGHASTLMMYGVDGKNKGFFFDGTTYTEVTTGMTADTPTHVYAHKYHLFYSFSGGSVQQSAPGDPTTWSPIVGAAELAIGEECVGFLGVPGQALAIFGRNKILILKGESVGSWDLDTFDDESGAIEWSLQKFKNPVFSDDRGVTNMTTVDAIGDFKASTLSQKIQAIVDQLLPELLCSMRVREKDHYRLFFDDERVLFFGMDGSKVTGATLVNYGIKMVAAESIEDTSGNEILLAGCEDGFVYRLDSGNSFDGNEVNAWIRPAFNHFSSPENKKRFFKVTLEIDAGGETELLFVPEFTYSDPRLPSAIQGSMDVLGGGGIWGSSDTVWGRFTWGAQLIDTAEGYIDGTGRNLSLFIRSVGTYDEPHTIQGAIIHYSVRGVQR